MRGLAIGLMSGTSADGVSAALCGFGGGHFRVLDYRTFPYPSALAKQILGASALAAPELSGLNFALGARFAEAAELLLKRNRVRPEQVAAIGSHGQTVFHGPGGRPPSTLQIGEPAVIAERTGVTVVSDFRAADVAAGGEGAPLMPCFDQAFFGRGPARALQNIGGIANVTVVGRPVKRPLAFDTGPGNCLIDYIVRKATRGKRAFDSGGRLAARGAVSEEILRGMAAHPFFRRSPPKSTGRELFGENFLPPALLRLLRRKPKDAVRTLTAFTAFTIVDAYRRFVPPQVGLSEVLVSGGGALNPLLMRELRERLSPIPVRSIWDYGLHPQAKEPVAFAYFAWRAAQGKSNHAPWGTGARGPRILGKITPGRNFGGIKV